MSATCDRVSGELYAAMRGELPASGAKEVADHLAACDACRTEQAGMASLASLLGSAPEPEPAAGGFLRIREAIERDERNRRRRLHLALPLALAAAAALLLAFLLPSSSSPGPSRLTALHGPILVAGAEVESAGAVTLRPGDGIRANLPCRFRIEGGREMDIVLDGGTLMAMADAARFRIPAGRAFIHVRPGAGEVVFVTPRGEAVVTGTRFTLTVTEDRTDLAVLDGEVTLRTGATAPVRVVSGYAVAVSADGLPGDPRKVDPWRVRDWFTRPDAALTASPDGLALTLTNSTTLPLVLSPFDPGSATYSLVVRDPDGRLESREVRLQALMVRGTDHPREDPEPVILAPGESYRIEIDPARALPRGRFLVSAVYKPYRELPPEAWRGVLTSEPVEITVGD